MRLLVCCLLASILLLGMAPSVVHADVEATDADLAAEAGHLPAEVHLAKFHVRGLYVPRDLAKSVTWFSRAVRHRPEEEARHRAATAEARYYLYQAHWNGHGGVRVDKEAALTYLKASADAGHRAAQADFAGVFESGGAGDVDLVEAHKYHVLRWQRGSDDGERSGMTRALALRKRMTAVQFEHSRARIREWLDAREAGRLGWVFDWCGRTRSYPITMTRAGAAWRFEIGEFKELRRAR